MRRRHRNRNRGNSYFEGVNDNYKSLNQCNIGEKVLVHSLNMCGNRSKRLMDMGLLPGTLVEISRVAPFGDPVAIKLLGFQMSIRKKEAEKILVENLA